VEGEPKVVFFEWTALHEKKIHDGQLGYQRNATQSNLPFVPGQSREIPTSPTPAVISLTKCSNMFGLGFILHGHQLQVRMKMDWPAG
jgi:hypothetical protein